VDRQSNIHSRLTWQLASLRVQMAMDRLRVTLKAGFRPDQPRVPRGDPDGGQWTQIPGYAQAHRVSRRRGGGGTVRIGGRSIPITPAQEAHLVQSLGAMRQAIRDVHRVDPAWKPPAQLYSSVDGLISANRAIEVAARFRIFELSRARAGIGRFAAEWIPAPPTNRRMNRHEQRALDRIGRQHGCHWCGTRNPGTGSGSFVGDHQMPKALGTPLRIYPHCLGCSRIQGGLLKHDLYGRHR
jgi:hypothetical protein